MRRAFVPAFAIVTMLAGPVPALETAWVEAGPARVRLLAAGAGDAGVEIRLAHGWKTYWRYPGDAGIPPRFDWTGSDNLARVEVAWPAPERLPEQGGTSIGYRDGVVFPLRVYARDPREPVKLALKLDFAVCEKICIPADAKLAVTVPVAGESMSALDTAKARVPRSARVGDGGRLAVLSVKVERGSGPRAVIDVTVPAGDFDLFAEGPTESWALPVPERISAASGGARFVLPLEGAPPGADPIPASLRLTLAADKDAIEVVAPLD
jgi:DsbC/DsbD-like thiol-disulfide interchange protein